MERTLAAPSEMTFRLDKEIQIAAPAAIVFESVLDQTGTGFTMPDGKSMQAKLEPWPGGRWYRDLGNNTGHFWGHVQVIKPPTLLELVGPMMMSYPVINHVQYRLTEKSGITTLTLIHRAMGDLNMEHLQGVHKGWEHILSEIKKRSQR
jgi:uncharacterized protein YndB with AHSA1/START domain